MPVEYVVCQANQEKRIRSAQEALSEVFEARSNRNHALLQCHVTTDSIRGAISIKEARSRLRYDLSEVHITTIGKSLEELELEDGLRLSDRSTASELLSFFACSNVLDIGFEASSVAANSSISREVAISLNINELRTWDTGGSSESNSRDAARVSEEFSRSRSSVAAVVELRNSTMNDIIGVEDAFEDVGDRVAHTLNLKVELNVKESGTSGSNGFVKEILDSVQIATNRRRIFNGLGNGQFSKATNSGLRIPVLEEVVHRVVVHSNTTANVIRSI